MTYNMPDKMGQMKRLKLVFLFVSLMFGCSPPNTSVPISNAPVNTPIPISTNTIAPSPTSSLEDIKCEDVKTINSDELNSKGTIVFHDMYYDAYTMNLNALTKVKLNADDEVVFSIAVSPDQQLAAYQLGSRNTFKSNLIIMDVSGVTQITSLWEEGWSFLASWLDNQRLLINAYGELSDGQPGRAAKEFSTFLVFNPFTGERELLEPDFPNIYSHHMFPAWSGFGSTLYAPNLEEVMYVKESDDGYYSYTLWSMIEKVAIADFKLALGQDIPQWSLDGRQIAITPSLLDNNLDGKWPANNLYTVDVNGQTRQITNLSEYFTWFYIGRLNWSPNGKHVAFWFSGWNKRPDSFSVAGDQYLGVVEVETKNLRIYCISGDSSPSGIVPPPVWSPNGSQILIESPLFSEHSQVLLLDLEEEIATKVGEDMTPIGWMVEP